MLGKLNLALLLIFLCIPFFDLHAQQYGYVQYSAASGAPFDQVSSVINDKEGYLWIGSENGLYRFDGIHFDLYTLQTESQYIHQLHNFGDELVFVNEISLYQVSKPSTVPEVNPMIEGTIDERDSLPFYPNDLFVASDQAIWISQSNHCIGRFRDGAYETYSFSRSPEARHLALAEDSQRKLWTLSPLDGLFCFNEKLNEFEKKLAISGGHSLLIVDNVLMIGNDALHIYSIEDEEIELIRTIELDDDVITAIHSGHRNDYIVGTQNGRLYKIADLNGSLEPVYGANEAHRVEELDFGNIYEIHVAEDSTATNDMFWVCAETGLWLLQQRFFRTVENLPMNNPISVAIGKGGKSWVPMSYLYEIAPKDNAFTARPILNNLRVNAVAQDKDGFTWVTTSTPKIELVKFKNERIVERHDFHERGEAIFLLYPDSKGNLWFCQAPVNKPLPGVARINSAGQFNYYDESKGFASRVLSIKESSRGEIYAAGIGEQSYLYRYDLLNDRFINLSPPLPFKPELNFEAHDLTIDDRGIVWLATTDGLLRYDSEKVTLIKNDVLGQEEIRGVTHYSNNNLWIATATNGLVFNEGNTSTVLGELEGLPGVICAYRCITTDEKGHLWAGTPEGLVYSRISAATLPHSKPPRVRKILAGEKEYRKGFADVIRIREGEPVSLEFTNLSYPAENVSYQYRLVKKQDKAVMIEELPWLKNPGKQTISLGELDSDEYYLEVRARQPGGYQWSKPGLVKLSVFSPWYLTSSFLYSLLSIFFISITYSFRIYFRKRLERLQKVLNYSKEKLANKEFQLVEKIRELEKQSTALADAHSNIETLELFIQGVTRQATWNDIITIMGKAVNRSGDINAFEIAFIENDEIVHRGYSTLERSGYTFRSKPFDPKTSLSSWAIANGKEVMINDYISEHKQYIEEKAGYRFNSLIFVPFKMENERPLVLCAYSVRKNDFDHNDLVMFRVLAQFIQLTVKDELNKPI
jgi:ligand-binding sensor domain-containing protein